MQVLTPTGYKHIEDINIGDSLVAYDISTGEIINNILLDKKQFTYDMLPPIEDFYTEDENGNQVLESSGKTSQEVYIDTYGEWKFYEINGTWKLYKNQSIWANDRVIHASELTIGDVIYNDENEDVIVISIEEKTDSNWWKLTVSGDHSYIADGVSLHNASRYWSGNMTPTGSNWHYTTGGTNWGSASGTADNASVPSTTDDVVFDGVGAKGNANSSLLSNITVGSVTFTSGYTGTVTFANTTTLTIAGNFTDNTAHSWVVSNNACYITISAAANINSGGKIWAGNIGFSNSNTKTLLSDWVAQGQLYCTISSSNTTINGSGYTLTVAGLQTNFNAATNGNATLRISGGAFNLGGGGNNVISLPTLEFAGSFNIPSITFAGSLLKYVSGNITTSGTLNLQGVSGITLDTNPIIWTNINLVSNAAVTYNINSQLIATGTMIMAYNGATTFQGSAGFTVGILTFGSSYGLSVNHSFKYGNNYIVTNGLALNANGGATPNFVSSDATNRVSFTLQQGATCSVNINFTRINASAGRTINTWNGVPNDSLNVRTYSDLVTVGRTFVS